MHRNSINTIYSLPPSWGRVGVRACDTWLLTPTLTLPHQGGGNRVSALHRQLTDASAYRGAHEPIWPPARTGRLARSTIYSAKRLRSIRAERLVTVIPQRLALFGVLAALAGAAARPVAAQSN